MDDGLDSFKLGGGGTDHGHGHGHGLHQGGIVGAAQSSDEDDGIYVLSEEDDLDNQTVLDLQLELSIVKKRLRSTELAYRALEDEYVQIKESNICLALLQGLEFSPLRYPDTLQGGSDAARDCATLVKQHFEEQAEQQHASTAKILIVWAPNPNTSRDFIQGFGAAEDTLIVETGGTNKLESLLATLLPLPQVKKVYTTLAPQVTSTLLLPYLKQAIDAAHELSNGQPYGNSTTHSTPPMRHRRSFTSASTLSSVSRSFGPGPGNANGNGNDSLLAKFVLLQTDSRNSESQMSIREIKTEAVKTYASNDTVLKDLADTDFGTLFYRLDCQNLWRTASAPIEAEPSVMEAIRAVKPRQSLQPVFTPEVPNDNQILDRSAHDQNGILSEDPVIEMPSVKANPANMWADIVRKGKSKEVVPSAAPVSNPAPAASTSVLSSNKQPVSNPVSPSMSTSPSMNSQIDSTASTTRPRRARGGSKKQEISSPPNGNTDSGKLDPTLSLCRQKKPPCNQYYLTAKGCNNPKCNYSHNYNLTAKQLDEMRIGAAKTACVYRKNKQPCSSGDECVFGHKCPQGARCKQNKCHFPPHMH